MRRLIGFLVVVEILFASSLGWSQETGACEIAGNYCQDQFGVCYHDCQDICQTDCVTEWDQCVEECAPSWRGFRCRALCNINWSRCSWGCTSGCNQDCGQLRQNCLEDEEGSCDGSLACENNCETAHLLCTQDADSVRIECLDACPVLEECRSNCNSECEDGRAGRRCRRDCRRQCATDVNQCTDGCDEVWTESREQCDTESGSCVEACLEPFAPCIEAREECWAAASTDFATCQGECRNNRNPFIYWDCLYDCSLGLNEARHICRIDSVECIGTLLADVDGDGFTPYQGDCDDSRADVNPDAVEVCDGVDNNCNGEIDEGIAPVDTTCGVGGCVAQGLLQCVGGEMVDNCTPGTPSDEICDTIDNDCNGEADDIDPVATNCGVGTCASTGLLICESGEQFDDCVPGEPDDEICDGLDNDCNESVDDEIAAIPTTCGIGACAATGQLTCQSGVLIDSCLPGSPTDEVCDGFDDNCNGVVDDDIPAVLTTCGVGACVSEGEQTCESGELVDSCVPGDPASEICDGIDNDCNEAVDDGILVVPTTCGIGSCASVGELTCESGELADSCIAGDPVDEVCDGIDNNCNGEVDDAIAAVPTDCGVGACASDGELTCVDAELVDSCTAGDPTDEVCDGVDNDCKEQHLNNFDISSLIKT